MAKGNRREVQQRSRAKLRGQARDALGGCCKNCGFDDHRVLEFDHIVPVLWRTNELKRMNGQHNTNEINRMVRNGEDPRTVYQLLCANCHRIKTLENRAHEIHYKLKKEQESCKSEKEQEL